MINVRICLTGQNKDFDTDRVTWMAPEILSWIHETCPEATQFTVSRKREMIKESVNLNLIMSIIKELPAWPDCDTLRIVCKLLSVP